MSDQQNKLNGLAWILYAVFVGLLAAALGYIRGQIHGRKYAFQNPPKRGEVIKPPEVTLRGKVIWRSKEEPFVYIPAEEPTEEQAECPPKPQAGLSIDLENIFDSIPIPRLQTKPPSEDFAKVYQAAKEQGLTRDQAYYYWQKEYPLRASSLQDPGKSFKNGMKTQERLHGKIWGD